jgi:chemotaxis protein MotB
VQNAKPEPFPPPARPLVPTSAAAPSPVAAVSSAPLVSDDDLVELRARRGGSVLPWMLFVAAAGALAFVWFGVYVPASVEHRGAAEQLETRAGELEAAQATAAAATTELENLRGENATLLEAKDELTTKATALEQQRDQLAETIASKAAELATAQKKLESGLADEIKSGDISIKKYGGELVVGVSDRVLFERGEAQLNKRGEKVMKRVAETIKANPERVFQVAGHTDDDPLGGALAEKFPTNWELSTARATHVVRFLIEQGGVEGRQLVAAGFAEQRPAASNRTEKGKHKNRRIEITMLMISPPKPRK